MFKEGHCKRHAIALVAAAAPRVSGKARPPSMSLINQGLQADVKAATKKWVTASLQFEGLVQLEGCPGFLPNARHHRMFGLMVLHAAYVAKQAFDGKTVNWREVYEVVVRWRREAAGAPIDNWFAQGGDSVAFSRNGRAFIALNRDSGSSFGATLQTGLPAGTYCNVIVSDDVASCPTVQVGSDGTAQVSVPQLSAVALHAGAKH